jgi:hypothetical protein
MISRKEDLANWKLHTAFFSQEEVLFLSLAR